MSWIPSELDWLSRKVRPLLHWHLISFVCVTAGSLLALLTPLVLRWVIDSVLPQKNVAMLLSATCLIFLGYQGKTMLTSFGGYLMLSSAQKMGMDLRIEVLRHLDELSADYYEETPVGAALYPLKEPIEEISYFGSDLLPAILRLILTTIFTLTTMFWLCPLLTFAVVPLTLVFLITRQHLRQRLASDSDRVQTDRLAWNSFLQEHLSSIVPIQLLGQERSQERRAFRFWARAVRAQHALFKTGMQFAMLSSVAVAFAMCAVLAFGGASVWKGTVSIGSLVAFYGFATQLFEPLSGASELYVRAQRTFASIRQIQSTLSSRPSVANVPGAVAISQSNSFSLEFVAVEFGYERNRDLLSVPTLRIPPGEQLGIVGENGAGKSSLAKLIARLYDPLRGSIRLGTEDIRSLRLRSLRDHVCYLSCLPVLFDGSLASNLEFARQGATDNDLHEAIERVNLSSFVASLPNGLQQRLGPTGCQLSGGQRQRVAIARALLQKPRILILDEATSCLDPAAETLILRNIRHGLPASTLIVVSHRPSTISGFGRVLVIRGGRIVSDGVPDLILPAQMLHHQPLVSAPLPGHPHSA